MFYEKLYPSMYRGTGVRVQNCCVFERNLTFAGYLDETLSTVFDIHVLLSPGLVGCILLWTFANFHFYRVLLHNELELTASRASLEYMKAAMAELTISRSERQRAREMLLMKHKKIEDFQKLAVRNLKSLLFFCFCFFFLCNIRTSWTFF